VLQELAGAISRQCIVRHTNAHEHTVGGTDGYHVVICGLFTDAVVGRNSVAGTATCYGLDCPGIQSRWGPWGPPSLLYNGYGVSFPGVKRSGRGVDHPPPSSAEVKEIVELYLCSPSGPS
jgi:hypothetical protein